MEERKKGPLIVGFVADLLFTTRIENVARHLGFDVTWISAEADIGEATDIQTSESPGESLHGRSGALFAKVTEWQPALLLFDLTNDEVPWRAWIPALKSSPATRRMPMICFGPHANVEVMTEARRLGAEVVVARSRFASDMPELFQKHARIPDHEALDEACQEPLSALAIEGIELHNKGEYYEAHEALEDAWMADEGPGRNLYRGMLQVTVAHLQIERGNYRGAVKMCLRVRQWLDSLPDVCRSIDVAQLRRNVEALHEALNELGPERVSDLDPDLLRPIRHAE